MSKTRDTGNIGNVVRVDTNGNVSFVSGSTTLMSVSSSGAVTTTGVISGSNALSASFSLNSGLLNSTGSVGFATTASLLIMSSSQQQISSSLLQVSASYIALSGSYNTFSGSASTRITANSSSIQQISSSLLQVSASLLNVVANYATTGSNSFRANQSITGSLVVSSTITAQTLVVQTVTSSIVYSSGSNLFGSALTNTQTFTGSVLITGSLTIAGVSSATSYSGTTIYGSTAVCSAVGKFTSCIDVGGAGTFSGNITNVSALYVRASGNSDLPFINFSNADGVYNWGRVGGLLQGDGDGSLYFQTKLGGSLGTRLTITSAGNVGIGITSPFAIASTNLSVNGSSSAIQLGVSNVRAVQLYADSAEARLYAVANVDLKFGTNDTERMRITSTGIACFACQVCAPMIFASTAIFSSVYCVNSYNSLSSTTSGQMGVLGHNAIASQVTSNTITQMNSGYFGSFIRQYYNEGITFYTRANAGTAGDVLYGTSPVADGGERMRITSTGIACFACQVCAPTFKGGSFNGTIGSFSCHVEIADNGMGWIYGQDKNHSIIMRGDRNGCVADYTNYYQYGGNLSTCKGHNFWTDGVLASQTIKMQIANNGICMTVPLYVCNSTNSRSFQTLTGAATIGAYGTCTLLYLSTSIAGTYIINASFGAQGLDIYGGMLIVVANGGSFRVVTNGSGTRSAITLSGCAVQLTNALGVTLDSSAHALYVGAL